MQMIWCLINFPGTITVIFEKFIKYFLEHIEVMCWDIMYKQCSKHSRDIFQASVQWWTLIFFCGTCVIYVVPILYLGAKRRYTVSDSELAAANDLWRYNFVFCHQNRLNIIEMCSAISIMSSKVFTKVKFINIVFHYFRINKTILSLCQFYFTQPK